MIPKTIPNAIGRAVPAGNASAASVARVGNPNLETALEKIAQLEARLAQLESAVVVGDDGSVSITAQGDLVLSSNKSIVIDGLGGITLQCYSSMLDFNSANVSLTCNSTFNLSTSQIEFQAGMIELNSPLVTSIGIIKCNVIQAATVMGTTYTPGVGNIW